MKPPEEQSLRAQGLLIISDEQAELIAQVCVSDAVPMASGRAIAKRFAASLKLLKALKQAVFVLEGSDESNSAELNLFRAAIAEAEGGGS